MNTRDVPPRLPLSVREGSVWVWEPLKLDARAEVQITETRWNGEEWWIETESVKPSRYTKAGDRHWNELDRFVEAAVLTKPDPGSST